MKIRFRFRLRVLFLGITVLACALAWFGSEFHYSAQVRKAIRQIQGAGGTTYPSAGAADNFAAALVWPKDRDYIDAMLSGLRRVSNGMLGERIRVVEFHGGHVTAVELEVLKDFPQIEAVFIWDTIIDEKMVRSISSNKNIRCVAFYRCQVKNDILQALGDLDHVESLEIIFDPILPVVQLDFVQDMKSLKVLRISAAIVQTDELEQLKNSSQLIGLDFSGSQLLGDINVLRSFSDLRVLSLNSVDVPVKSLTVLRELPKLETFSFLQESLSKEDVDWLRNLTNATVIVFPPEGDDSSD